MGDVLMDINTKSCFVKLTRLHSLTKLRTCEVLITKKSTKRVSRKTNLSRDEKILLLPKKNAKIKTGRIEKKKKDKFQMKITSFFDADRASPDSGISSRPDTPGDDEDITEEDVEVASDDAVKEEFLKSLDDEGLEEESSDEEESDWEDAKEQIWVQKKKPKKNARMEKIVLEPVEKSDYELSRDKKIQEKEEMLRALKVQWQSFKAATVTKAVSKPRVYTPRPACSGEIRRSGRSLGGKVEYTELDEPSLRQRSSQCVRAEFDEDEFRYAQRDKVRGTRSTEDPNVNVLQPEDVSECMIQQIHQSGKKKYCSATGTCCHQCRQKTVDTKTVCRSGECSGLRGQFCGTCLLQRYGEKVEEALRDPDWCCPPCRRICNCSFCLETPTGQLFHLAKHRGFASVHHYLEHLRQKWDSEN